MLDISETIIDYLVAETGGENEIDKALEEVLAWRKRNKDGEQERKQRELSVARENFISASLAYQNAMMNIVGEKISAEDEKKDRVQLEKDLQKSEALLTTLAGLRKDKPAADKERKCQTDEDRLKAFLEGLK
jgi:hypothetical protein